MENVICRYNGKEISMEYVADKKEQFKYACMRIRDNAAEGTVEMPDGKIYEIKQGSNKAKLIKST